jgi:hypothetical protein
MRKFYFIILLPTLFQWSCKDESAEPVSENCVENLGTFDLLPTSLQLPYSGQTKAFFTDSIFQSISFSISRYDNPALKVKNPPPIEYCFTTHQILYTLSNDSIGITLRLSLMANPARYSSTEIYVSDDLDITYEDLLPVNASDIVFHKPIDYRGGPELLRKNMVFDSIVILNRTFYNVEQTKYTFPTNWLLYNASEGIVAFEDDTNHKWRFDHME